MKGRKSNADWRLGDDQALLLAPRAGSCGNGPIIAEGKLATGKWVYSANPQRPKHGGSSSIDLWFDRSTTKDVVLSCIG